jgi:hypothetical protein
MAEWQDSANNTNSGARQICLPETHLYYPESYPTDMGYYLRQSTMSCRKSTKRQSKRFLEVFVRERGSLTARNRPPQARNATPTQSALLRFCPTCTSPRLGQHRRWVPHASYTRSMPKSVLPPELWLKISAIFPRIFSLQSHSLVVPFDLSPNHFFSLPSPPTPNALRPRRRTEGVWWTA